MVTEVLEDIQFKNFMKIQVKNMVQFLLNKDKEFALTANIKAASFEPELPSSIMDKLSKFSLFVLQNYTYSTIKVDDDNICFEAGFGSENFGSTVTIPLESIFQIVIDDSILLLNPIATVEKFNESKASINRSFNVFKKNPHNDKFK